MNTYFSDQYAHDLVQYRVTTAAAVRLGREARRARRSARTRQHGS
jgi:hypothetical protein